MPTNGPKGPQQEPVNWQQDVFRVLKAHDVKHIAYVRDAGHSRAIRAAEVDDTITSVVLTAEEEGIGYLAGAWLGGEHGALMMQSLGAGNCINPLALQAMARFISRTAFVRRLVISRFQETVRRNAAWAASSASQIQ